MDNGGTWLDITTLPKLVAHLDLVEPGDEIFPGIQAIAAPGHAPGQMALAISSGQERLLALTDVFLHPVHIEHPEWVVPFDYDPKVTVQTRSALYVRAVTDNALITAGHLAWPCLGHIRQNGVGTHRGMADRLGPGMQIWEQPRLAVRWGFDAANLGFAETGMTMSDTVAESLPMPGSVKSQPIRTDRKNGIAPLGFNEIERTNEDIFGTLLHSIVMERQIVLGAA